MRIIKRYNNRKLYDTDKSKYISLIDVAELVKSGESFSVVHNGTKKDITLETVGQAYAKYANVDLDMVRKAFEGVDLDEKRREEEASAGSGAGDAVSGHERPESSQGEVGTDSRITS